MVTSVKCDIIGNSNNTMHQRTHNRVLYVSVPLGHFISGRGGPQLFEPRSPRSLRLPPVPHIAVSQLRAKRANFREGKRGAIVRWTVLQISTGPSYCRVMQLILRESHQLSALSDAVSKRAGGRGGSMHEVVVCTPGYVLSVFS